MVLPHEASQDDIEDVAGSDVIRLAEEEVRVGVRKVLGDTISITTVTEVDTVPVNAQLRSENYAVRRVAKNEVVSKAIPDIRTEDGVTIIPVLEERLVVRKEVILREEIHLVPEHGIEDYEDEIELRKQSAIIERTPPDH